MREKSRTRSVGKVVALASVAVLMLAETAMAQTFTTPRHSEHDQPNLEGIWQVMDTSVHFNVEPHEGSFAVPPGQGVIGDPAD